MILSILKRVYRARKTSLKKEKSLQKQRPVIFRTFDIITITGFFCSILMLFVSLQLIKRIEDMNQIKHDLLAKEVLIELKNSGHFTDQQSLFAVTSSMKAYNNLTKITDYKIFGFKNFISDILFYKKGQEDQKFAPLKEKEVELTLPIPKEYLKEKQQQDETNSLKGKDI